MWRIENASVTSTAISAGSNAKPLTSMKPMPKITFTVPLSRSSVCTSISGNTSANTTTAPATKQAARKPKKVANRRPITAMWGSVRHRHCAQRVALAHRQFLRLGFQLPAGRKNVAAARRAHRRGIAGVEHVFGEFLDLLPVRAFILAAGPRVERNE